MSAYTSLEGEFTYNSTLLAPLGLQIIASVTPSEQPSWAPHRTKAWYIGPAMNHYRCITAIIPKTEGTVIADIFKWSETNPYVRPKISHEEQLTIAAHDLARAICHNNLYTLPNQDLREQINNLESLFRTTVESITRTKLTPLVPELSSYNTQEPRVTKHNLQKQPRVINNTEQPNSNSLTLETTTILSTKQPDLNISQAYHKCILQNESTKYRYPICSIVAQTAATIQ